MNAPVKLKDFKVTSLPASPEAHAIYYVKAPASTTVTVYVTDATGTAVPLAGGGGGGGGVDSVNGATGDVVLDHTDVGAAAASHTHAAAAISDSSAVGRSVLTAADAAAVRSAIGVGTGTGDMVGANNLSDLGDAATSRSNLGLGNVNNTSDANKPVSTYQQTAIDAIRYTFLTRALMEAATIPGSIITLATLTRAAAGDRGCAMWERLGSPPSPVEDWHAQTADGAYWSMMPAQDNTIAPEALGPIVEASGSASANATTLLSALEFCAAKKCDMRLAARDYYCNASLVVPDYTRIIGVGGGYLWDHRTKLIAVGTGSTSYSLTGFTAITFSNPGAGEAYLADSGTRGNTYTTLNYGTSFSAFIIIGRGCSIENCGIYPNFNGVTDYSGSSSSLSDDWDVGVWCRNAEKWRIDYSTVAGHWRMSALLCTASDIGDGRTPSCQAGQANQSWFQGFRGVTMRLPETDLGSNWGMAGTHFIDCDVRPLEHQSLHLATSSTLSAPFASPSAAVELSGLNLRGIEFTSGTMIGRDDICMLFGVVSEVIVIGTYHEAKTVKVSGSWLANSLGQRLVAGSGASRIIFNVHSKYGIDMSPYQTRDGSLSGERYTAAGAYSPTTSTDDDYEDLLYSTLIGKRLRYSGQRWGIADQTNTEIFSIAASGLVKAKHISTDVLEIADDTAVDLPTPRNGGFCKFTNCGGSENSAFPSVGSSGIVIYDTGSTVSIAKSAGGGGLAVVTTDVTGTTGTDGNLTIGVVAGKLRVENRTGATAFIRYTFDN